MSTDTTEGTTQYFVFGPFVFDIDKALELVASKPDRPTRTLDVDAWAKAIGVEKTLAEYHEGGTLPLLRGDIDEEYARTKADLSVPVILADIRVKRTGEQALMLIDGTHRLRRAFLERVPSLRTYVLNFSESRSIRSEAQYGHGRTRRRATS